MKFFCACQLCFCKWFIMMIMMMSMMTSIIRHKVPAPAIAVLSLLREQEEDVLCSSKTMAPYCLCEPGCFSAPSASCCPRQPDRRGPCLERHTAVGLGVRHLRLAGPGLSGGDHTRRPHQKGNRTLYTGQWSAQEIRILCRLHFQFGAPFAGLISGIRLCI